MIFAELRGKLGSDGRLAHDRAEDLLTSTVFGLLRYIPAVAGLLPLLRSARKVVPDAGQSIALEAPGFLALAGATDCTVEPWPWRDKSGEPDLLLSAMGPGERVTRVLIEAKLWSPKSGRAAADETVDPDVPDPDQLVRYWRALEGRYPKSDNALIYLTSHWLPPARELRESLNRDRDMRLGWMSWREVWAVCSRIPGSLPAHDLTELLKHKGFSRFEGFSPLAPIPEGTGAFWRRPRWFAGHPVSVGPSAAFWKPPTTGATE